jgi:hypothetical protein
VVVARIAEPNGLVEAIEPKAGDVDKLLEGAPAPMIVNAPEVTPTDQAAVAPRREAMVANEDDVRRGVLDRLRTIDRLPPSNADLSTAVLLSIDSMYADLWSVNDDDEREACIRESFPNETLLRTAMLALIEQLDPSVDTHDPIIRDADVSGLMKIVLFEERRRRDGQSGSPRPSPAPNRRHARCRLRFLARIRLHRSPATRETIHRPCRSTRRSGTTNRASAGSPEGAHLCRKRKACTSSGAYWQSGARSYSSKAAQWPRVRLLSPWTSWRRRAARPAMTSALARRRCSVDR